MERRKGKHLSWNDRLTIERMLIKGYDKKTIAAAVGCCMATIYNEIKRASYIHTDPDLNEELRYNPDEAQRKYDAQLKKKGVKAKLLQAPKLVKYIESMIIDLKFSPQAVLFEIERNKLVFEEDVKSVNTIYSGIKKGYFENLGIEYLPQHSRHTRKKGTVKKQKRASKGNSIEKREPSILDREQFGHWEMDCVVGKINNRKTMLVLTERKTRFEITEVLKAHTSYEVTKALNRIEKRYGSAFFDVFKTITVDNGSEFTDWEAMEKALYRTGRRTSIYYCHPSAPHERGSNENNNKLIRRFFPKGADFDLLLKRRYLKDIEYWINTYPRKMFDGMTSLDKFALELELMGIKNVIY